MQVNPPTQFTHYFVVDTTGGVLQVADPSLPSPVLQVGTGTIAFTSPEISCAAATVCSPTVNDARSLLHWISSGSLGVLLAGADLNRRD
jgi:hypothetical protein